MEYGVIAVLVLAGALAGIILAGSICCRIHEKDRQILMRRWSDRVAGAEKVAQDNLSLLKAERKRRENLENMLRKALGS